MREIEFRVFDLHDGKVLYGEQIPKKGNGLVESCPIKCRRFSPGPGLDGGKVQFSGLPIDFVKENQTLTSKHLKLYTEKH